MSKYTFDVEPLFPELIKEMQPLLQEQYDELSGYESDVLPLEPDYIKLKELDDNGILITITCRDTEKKLIGYSLWFVQPHLHYRLTKTAHNDIYYIKQDSRGHGAGTELFKHAITLFKSLEVKRVIVGTKVTSNHGPLLESFGFKHFENFYDLMI